MKEREKPLIVRAFSPDMKKPTGSWGDAPGWYKSAPLALTDHLDPMFPGITRRVFSRCLNSKGLGFQLRFPGQRVTFFPSHGSRRFSPHAFHYQIPPGCGTFKSSAGTEWTDDLFDLCITRQAWRIVNVCLELPITCV